MRTHIKVEPGAIAVGCDGIIGADVVASGPGIVALEIDLSSKRAKASYGCDSGGEHFVLLGADKYTTKTTTLQNETRISFPAYPGWRVYLAEVGKYTLRVVIVKDALLSAPSAPTGPTTTFSSPSTTAITPSATDARHTTTRPTSSA